MRTAEAATAEAATTEAATAEAATAEAAGEEAAVGFEVGLIDFQWSGFGLAATDVAHHIAAALDAEQLSVDGAAEAALLDGYHAALCEAMVETGVAETALDASTRVFPRAALQAQYETACLDMCRLVFAYQWSRARFGQPNLNRNSYNKSLRSAVWLTARCDALLRARGV